MENPEKIDYNALFKRLQDQCDYKNSCNVFSHITYDELVDLNNLLDKVLIFCDNIDFDELEAYEAGESIVDLYKLVNDLQDKDMGIVKKDRFNK